MDVFSSVKAFVAVAEEGGFAKAARKTGAATSSVMRQVDALQEYLGAILLNRSTRSVSLTPAGEAYYLQAARILSDLDEANQSVGELTGPPRGLLRVSLPVAFARLHVAPIVPEFLKSCPGIELEFLMTDNVVNLVEDRIDVAIRIGSLESSSLVARKLAPNRRVLCASPQYIRAHGEPRVPADLAQHNCLTFSYSTGDRTWRFTRAGQNEQVRVRGNLRANHSETLKEAALAGLALQLLFCFEVRALGGGLGSSTPE
jgi:DNA-binding transcriptional LysR family regulator